MKQVDVRDVGVTTDDVGVARYGTVGDNTLKVPETDIIFTVNSDPLEELIRISKGTFYWKGEPVEDTQKIHERFCEWMKIAIPLVAP